MTAALMFAVGGLLSAFFSGSETGFYRVSRVRLALDAIGGDRTARGILWLTNNSGVFVATSLIGNNLANYLLSLAVVLVTGLFFPHGSVAAELLGTVIFSPFVFVYGELLPKNLFYRAPNKLLRWAGPPFLLLTVAFAPVAAVLWGVSRLLQWALGEAPEQMQLSLARRELQRMLQEGQEAGVLHPTQRALSQNLFAMASQKVEHLCTPVSRVVAIRQGSPRDDALQLARRQRTPILAVMAATERSLVGYVQVIDLRLTSTDRVEQFRPLMEIPADESHLAALARMEAARQSLAVVVDARRQVIGAIHADRLLEPLLRFQ